MRLKFCQEALLWLKLDHPHILPLIGIYREPLTELSSSLFMVSPWMGEGTVLTHLKDVGMADVNRLLLQIAQGLQYLHSQGIVHGDLRGRNILITTDWTVRLIDFGLSRSFDASRRTSKEGGSLRWMAPELIDPEEFGLQFRPTPATDVYAFGCVCVELYTGQPPFSHIPMDASDYAIVRCVMDGERPERPTEEPLMTDRFWNCVTTYWGQNYTIRPSAEVIVSDMTGVAVESSGPSDEMVSDPTPSLSQKAPTMTLAACVETFFMPQLDSEAKDNVQRIPAAEGSTALLAAVA
ncbi:kinase-like domain-containing protein [Mycena epipterygia]|nr:kinase-like domain-containing protein [Mycena epipterygia]